MRRKEYKVGERVFYECYPSGEIGTAIIKRIENESYKDDSGKERPFKWLILQEVANCSAGIEDYNCLSSNNPKVKELAKKFAKFDKQKDSIMGSLSNILSPWGKETQKEIIELLKTQLKVEE
jgi:hypothetical protein